MWGIVHNNNTIMAQDSLEYKSTTVTNIPCKSEVVFRAIWHPKTHQSPERCVAENIRYPLVD